jgi:hypothetical protein
MKKIILKNEKICHERWISIGRFCFRSGVTAKALEKMDLSQHLTTAVISTGGWGEQAYYREKVKTLCGRTDVIQTRPCENRVWRGSRAAAKRSYKEWQATTRQGPAGNPGINLVHPRSSLNILYSK